MVLLLQSSNGNTQRRPMATRSAGHAGDITLINLLSWYYGDVNKPPPRAAPSGLGSFTAIIP